MNADEVKEYLDSYQHERQARHAYMDALRRYVSKYDRFLHIPEIRGTCLAIMDRTKDEQKNIEDQSVTVRRWSELLSGATRRAIFIDRYIHDMDIESIEDKYHYCKSTVFRIMKLCIEEIASKT